jgi:putative membrane protein
MVYSIIKKGAGAMDHRNRGLFVLLAALVVVLLAAPIISGVVLGPEMMWGFRARGVNPPVTGWGLGVAIALGRVLSLAFWGALIVAVLMLFRWATGATERGHRPTEAALDILRRRYAAGEITKEQFEEMQTALASSEGGGHTG